jgi:large subunit ribosomal protein L28
MAFICDRCGKGTVHGRQSTHGRGVAGRRWKKRAQTTMRVFKPNLQKMTVTLSGEKIQLRLCTDCISRFRKEGKITKTRVLRKVASI